MIPETLLEKLTCPTCGGQPLRLDVDEVSDDVIIAASLMCPDCKRWHRVENDVPTLMPPELAASLRAAGGNWEPWRDAMAEFLHWRDRVWSDPAEATQRAERALAMHERFIAFCELPQGSFECIDIGCGSGHLADLLGDECDYVGIDPLPAGRAPGGELPEHMPRPSRSATFIQGVGEKLPFVSNCFDVALLTGTLDHCRDPEQVLVEASRVLRPGATLAVLQGIVREEGGGGFSLRSLASKLAGGAKSGDVRTTHLHGFSADELGSLLSSQFECRGECEDESGRLFIRAVVPGGEA